MGLLTSLLVGASAVASIGAKPSAKIIFKEDIDNYEYQFRSSTEFDVTNGDEFESLDAQSGINSEITIKSVDGLEETIKRGGRFQNAKKNTPARAAASFTDGYEDNDSFENATSLYDVGFYEDGIYMETSWADATISQKSSGWWIFAQTYIDKDFYSFDCCVTGLMTVTLTNIPQNCDYELRAYRLEDGPRARVSQLDFNNYFEHSFNGLGREEYIRFRCIPGTYFFCVYSYQDQTYDNENPYRITVQQLVDYVPAGEGFEYWISEGKARGDKAALWVSDYKPLGYTPVTLSDENSRVALLNYDDYPYIHHLADKYQGNDYINYAVLYVWDVETRECISRLAAALVEAVDSATDWENNQSKSVEIFLSSAGLVLSVGGFVISTIGLLALASVTAAFLSGLGLLVSIAGLLIAIASLAYIFVNNQPYITKKKDLLAYLVSVQQTFSTGVGSNDNETKIMRFRYRFERNGDTRYLDWSPFYSSLDYNFYNDDYICYQINHSGIDGTVKGMSSFDEISNFLGV